MNVRSILRGVGKALIAAGLIVLLFVAYELWGTGLATSAHQHALRRQFNKELQSHHIPSGRPATVTTVPRSTTTTTQPIQSVQSPEAPPANGQPVGVIDIPKIGANYVVVEGTNTGDLQLGPGHYVGTALPGNPGNAAVAGHRTTYLRPFYNLDQLAPGVPIYVTTTQGRFQYDVTDTLVVSPNDVAVLDPTATPTLTLTTCNPRFSASTRMVVQAALVTPVVAAVPIPAVKASANALPAKTNLGGSQGGWLGALLWGLALVAVAVVASLARRRLRRWWVAAIGVVGMLIVLFYFFGAINPLLPAGY